MKGTGIAGTL